MPGVRQFSCPNCGAPLRWKGEARVIECAYCKTHIVTETRTITREPTRVVATKPGSSWIPLLGAVILLAGLAIALAVTLHAGKGNLPGGVGRTPVAELAKYSFDHTPQEFGKRYGGSVFGRGVTIKLKDTEFDRVLILWDEETSKHAQGFHFYPPEKVALPPRTLERAQKIFGAQLTKQESNGSYGYYSQGASFNLGKEINGYSDPEKPGSQERLAMLWRVAQHVVFGAAFELDAKAQAVLNVGYELVNLAEIDPSVPVTKAEAEVKRVYPGAAVDGPQFGVGIEHPWFSYARISWKNEPGGSLDSISLTVRKEVAGKPFVQRALACLSSLGRKPNESVTDALKDERHYSWYEEGKPGMNLSQGYFSLSFGKGKGSVADFRKHLATLASCK